LNYHLIFNIQLLMKKVLIFLLLTYFTTTVFGQTVQLKKDGSLEHHETLMQDPAYAQSYDER
jgi:hypothetical protein